MTLRVWSDHPAYKTCSAFNSESFIELTGEFHSHPQYGLEAHKVDGAATHRTGKKRIAPRPGGFARQTERGLGIYRENRSAQLAIPACAHYAKRSSKNGATGFVAPLQRAIIIMPGAADWSSTPRK